MTAGANLKGRVWRLINSQDDSVGGSVPTGTVLYFNVQARISSEKPTLALLEQGLETPTIFKATISYPYLGSTGTYDLQHNDQLEIVWPPISPHYNKKFRIIGIQNTSFNDGRRYVQCTLRRTVTANSNEVQ